MNGIIFIIGLLLLAIGALYLLPIFGMNLIPFALPTFGQNPMFLGGGIAGFGFILLIAGIKMV